MCADRPSAPVRRPELDKTKNLAVLFAFIVGLGYKDTAESWAPFSSEDEDDYDPTVCWVAPPWCAAPSRR